MRKEYGFYLTDAQINVIHDLAISMSELCFTAGGVVKAVVWYDYEIVSYIFRKDGTVLKEVRGLDSDVWDSFVRDVNGVWVDELGEVVNV